MDFNDFFFLETYMFLLFISIRLLHSNSQFFSYILLLSLFLRFLLFFQFFFSVSIFTHLDAFQFFILKGSSCEPPPSDKLLLQLVNSFVNLFFLCLDWENLLQFGVIDAVRDRLGFDLCEAHEKLHSVLFGNELIVAKWMEYLCLKRQNANHYAVDTLKVEVFQVQFLTIEVIELGVACVSDIGIVV